METGLATTFTGTGGYLMVGGCRLHIHSRTTGQHVLSKWRERNHEHDRVVERSQIHAIQS